MILGGVAMAWRIAISSIDDVLINQHFGRARWFYIRDLERDGSSVSRGRRTVTALCDSCENHEPGMETTIATLGDCAAVLTAKIGPHVRARLESAGIAVFEEPAVIDEALLKLAVWFTRTKQPESPI
jgi:predicted Fe-Mo cluster-binding NifX family protein